MFSGTNTKYIGDIFTIKPEPTQIPELEPTFFWLPEEILVEIDTHIASKELRKILWVR